MKEEAESKQRKADEYKQSLADQTAEIHQLSLKVQRKEAEMLRLQEETHTISTEELKRDFDREDQLITLMIKVSDLRVKLVEAEAVQEQLQLNIYHATQEEQSLQEIRRELMSIVRHTNMVVYVYLKTWVKHFALCFAAA